jgi:hypothetical protein
MKILFKKLMLLFSKKRREELKSKKLVGQKIVEKFFTEEDEYKSYSDLMAIMKAKKIEFFEEEVQSFYSKVVGLKGKKAIFKHGGSEELNEIFLIPGNEYEVVDVKLPYRENFNENYVFFVLKSDEGVEVMVGLKDVSHMDIPAYHCFDVSANQKFSNYIASLNENKDEQEDEIVSQTTNVKLTNGYRYISEYVPNGKKITIFELESHGDFEEFISAVEKHERSRLNIGYGVIDFVFVQNSDRNFDDVEMQNFAPIRSD